MARSSARPLVSGAAAPASSAATSSDMGYLCRLGWVIKTVWDERKDGRAHPSVEKSSCAPWLKSFQRDGQDMKCGGADILRRIGALFGDDPRLAGLAGYGCLGAVGIGELYRAALDIIVKLPCTVD